MDDRELVQKTVAYAERRVNDAYVAFEKILSEAPRDVRANSHRTFEWEVYSELKDVYGQFPANPELYEEEDWLALNPEVQYPDKPNNPVEDTWEDFYTLLVQYDMVDEEAKHLAVDYGIDEPLARVRYQKDTVEVLISWDAVRTWRTNGESVGEAVTDAAFEWAYSWNLPVNDEEGPEVFVETLEDGTPAIGVRFERA